MYNNIIDKFMTPHAWGLCVYIYEHLFYHHYCSIFFFIHLTVSPRKIIHLMTFVPYFIFVKYSCGWAVISRVIACKTCPRKQIICQSEPAANNERGNYTRLMKSREIRSKDHIHDIVSVAQNVFKPQRFRWGETCGDKNNLSWQLISSVNLCVSSYCSET